MSSAPRQTERRCASLKITIENRQFRKYTFLTPRNQEGGGSWEQGAAFGKEIRRGVYCGPTRFGSRKLRKNPTDSNKRR